MSDKTTFWQEVWQFVGKGLIYLFYITLGVVTKLAFEAQTALLSNKQKIIKVVLSIFCGYLAAAICEWQHQQNFAKVIVPVATLLGDNIVNYLISNWKTFIPKKWRRS